MYSRITPEGVLVLPSARLYIPALRSESCPFSWMHIVYTKYVKFSIYLLVLYWDEETVLYWQCCLARCWKVSLTRSLNDTTVATGITALHGIAFRCLNLEFWNTQMFKESWHYIRNKWSTKFVGFASVIFLSTISRLKFQQNAVNVMCLSFDKFCLRYCYEIMFGFNFFFFSYLQFRIFFYK